METTDDAGNSVLVVSLEAFDASPWKTGHLVLLETDVEAFHRSSEEEEGRCSPAHQEPFVVCCSATHRWQHVSKMSVRIQRLQKLV